MAKVQIKTNANGTGILTIQAPNTDTDRTMNIPDSDGTMLLNIADDPTPQLGANLDTNGYNITGSGAIEIEGNISTDGTISGNITGNQSYYAKATEAISKGEVVMFNSAQGSHILIELADTQAVGFKPEYVIGIAAETMATNDFGIVVAFGKITGVDTDTYNNGDILYLDNSTAGGVTTTKPSPSDGHTIIVAAVSNAASNGTLQVRLSHEPDTDEVEEGSTNLYYTDARVGTYLSSNGYDTAANIKADLVDSAPATLDTLNELAAALGDDANFSTTVTNSIATKLAKSSNLSDLTDAATARTNLGLGTAATTASTDYATAAQGTTADSALQDITGESIKSLSDVYGSMSPTDGQLLTWDNANSRWGSADAPVSLPSQTGNSGYYLTTDGSSASWADIGNTLSVTNRAGSTVSVTLTASSTLDITNRAGSTVSVLLTA